MSLCNIISAQRGGKGFKATWSLRFIYSHTKSLAGELSKVPEASAGCGYCLMNVTNIHRGLEGSCQAEPAETPPPASAGSGRPARAPCHPRPC